MTEERLPGAADVQVTYATNRLLLKFPRQATPEAIAKLLAWHNLERADTPEGLARLGYCRVRITDGRSPRQVLDRLSRQRGGPALRAEPDFGLVALGSPVPAGPLPGYVTGAGFDRAWAQCDPAAEVIVAVVDTGVNGALPELRDACLEGFDVIAGRPGAPDDHGHGTAMAGIIAAARDTAGVPGLCPGARILPVKALDATGCGLASDVATAVVYAADHGAGVINLSLGGYAAPRVLADAIAYAVEKGCLVVGAAGNDGCEARMYPAAFPDVIAVSALAADGAIWPDSNHGPYVDVAAPGGGILCLSRDGRWVPSDGTSASAAIVSALAGLLRETYPDRAIATLRQAMLVTARDRGAPGRDDLFGWGALDAGLAMAAPAPEIHDVALSRAGFETAGLSPGERPVLCAYLRNAGTFAEERADVEVRVNGRAVAMQPAVTTRRETRVVFELDPFPADASRFEFVIRAVPLGKDADPGNNAFTLRGLIRDDPDRRMRVLLKDRPFVHSWVALQGYALLPPGPLKTEIQDYLWGGATYEDLFGDDVRWEEDVADLDVSSWWSEPSGSGNCVLEGAYEEDNDEYGIDLGPHVDSFMNHFWDPDVAYDYGLEKEVWSGRHHSALWRAHRWWNWARDEYLLEGDKDTAYYLLGRIAHLLADMSTPEHVHLDIHPSDDVPWSAVMDVWTDTDDFSNYEEYTKMVFREYVGSGSPIPLDDLPLALPTGYVPSDYDADFCRLFYNMAQFAQLFDSSDADGNSVGYGGAAIDLGRPAQAGAARRSFPAIAYLDGRAEPRIDPHTDPTVKWQKLGLTGYHTYKTLPEGPGDPAVDHYVEFGRGEGVIGVPSNVWDDMGLLDRFHVDFQYKGTARSDNILNFDNWPDKDQYAFIPDPLVAEQADILIPLVMRYTAALYELFWQRVHPRPPAPTTLNATDGAYSDRIVLDWTNVDGEDGYYVWCASSTGGVYSIVATNAADAVTFEHPNAGAVTNWYQVTAFNLGGQSDDSPVDRGHTLTPAPPTPQSVAASNATYTNQVRVTWADGAWEEGYTIHRADTWDGTYVQIGSVGANVTQYDDPRPAGGVWYYYKVQAFNGTGGSELSSSAGGRTAASSANYPAWIDATDGTYPNGIMVTWDAVVGAADYLVYRGLSFSGSFSLVHTTAGTETSYYDDLGASGLTYWYYVIAHYAAGGYSISSTKTSGFSGVALPAVPAGVAASDGTYTDRIHVAWSAVAGATSYQVYRAASAAGAYGMVGAVTGTSYDQSTAPGSAPWYFKVRALNSRGPSALSAADSGYTSSPAPDPPARVVASDGAYDDRIRIEWTPVPGASGYTLGRAAGAAGPFTEFVSVGGATPWYEDAQPPACAPLYYRVVAYVGGQPSVPSAADSGYTCPAPPPAPANVQASDGTWYDRVRVTWNDSAGAESYRIERSDDVGAAYIPRGETAAGVCVFDDPVAPGLGPFDYRVTACSTYGESDPGGPDAGYTNPGPPAVPAAPAASDGLFPDRIEISWARPPAGVEIRVFEALGPDGPFDPVSDWLRGDIATSFIRTDDEIKPDRLYYYQLCARNAYGESASSETDSGWAGGVPPTVAAPVFDPPECLSIHAVTVTVTCATAGAEIHYTLDGATPGLGDPLLPVPRTVVVERPTTLKARAWKTGWFPSAEATGFYGCTGGDPHLLVLGDAQGAVLLLTLREGRLVARTNLFHAAVASVRALDADGDGVQDILALPAAGGDEPAVCLDDHLRVKWRSADNCGLAAPGRCALGAAAQAADVDGDGRIELVLMLADRGTGQVQVRIVSGETGETLFSLPEALSACPRLFFDARSGHYRLAVARTDGARSFAAAFDLLGRDWAWTREDRAIGPCGAGPRVLWESDDYAAALWGGTSNALWLVDGDGEEPWGGPASCAAGAQVTAWFADGLTRPGEPALLVEGAFEGDGVCVDALDLMSGGPVWTWRDPKGIGSVQILALGNVDAADDQEVFVLTGGDAARDLPPQIQAIKGVDGSGLWSRPYDPADHIAPEAKLVDADGDGKPELIVAVNHRIEVLDARTGDRIGRLEGESVILSFDLLKGFTDSDGDGQQDWAEDEAGTAPDDAASSLRIVEFQRTGNGLQLGWPGAAGRHYEILMSDDLRTGFHVMTNNIPAALPRTRIDHVPPTAATRGFYRVRIHE